MKILAVIPARAGSQRMPGKNRCEITPGTSLTQHAIDSARHSGVIDRVVVSTDDNDNGILHADIIDRPESLRGPTTDIAHVVDHALEQFESDTGEIFDYVVTLQPAVLARSPLIVRRLVLAVVEQGARGGITAARTVPWIHQIKGGSARYCWHSGPYPRSQDAGHFLAEINAVQVATRDVVLSARRWALPLIYAELPPWTAALDIDEPADLAMARDLWPWAEPRLETTEPIMHFTTEHGKP